MKKFLVSAGLVAVGATGLQAAYAPGLSRMQTSKPWSVSASLRGFYDDNYLTLPAGQDKRDSLGFEITPSISLNFPREQSYIGFEYIYSIKYYDDREDNKTDESHAFNLKAAHRFSERYKIELDDAFIYSQEPEVISDIGTANANPLRTESDVVRNRANLDFTAQLTELMELQAGYQNTFYDYTQDAHDVGIGSRSALLDRMEHLFHLDGRWLVRPKVVGIVGYQFGIFDYTSDDPISFDTTTGQFVPGDIRDNISHYGYVGADYSPSSQINVSGRVGFRYTDYDDLSESDTSPYVLISGTYTYLPGSYLQFGVRHDRNATDVTGTVDDITLDAESTTFYGSVNHRITPQLTGSLLGQFQISTFNGGAADGSTDNFYVLGLNFEYRFNQNWFADAGYNFDRLDSDLGNRSFSRNRIYLGVRATY